MAVVSSFDIQAENDRKLIAMFAEMHAASRRAETYHEAALLSIEFLKSRTRDQRFRLLDLIRDQPQHPPVATHGTNAGEQGRPAIGASNAESRSTSTLARGVP